MHCDRASGRRMALPMSSDIASGLAARNLKLLEAIESTITSLSNDLDVLALVGEAFAEILSKFQGKPPDFTIDPAGRIEVLLSAAGASCSRLYAVARAKNKAAAADPALTPDDGVTEAYDDYIHCITAVHDRAEELREWIATHDALLEPTTGEKFKNVNDLFEAMGF